MPGLLLREEETQSGGRRLIHNDSSTKCYEWLHDLLSLILDQNDLHEHADEGLLAVG